MTEKSCKQTAVDWLFEKLWNTDKDKFTWHNILEQAQEMEKQQIIDAFSYQWQGWYEYIDKDGCLNLTNVPINKNADEYYNSIYNRKDETDK